MNIAKSLILKQRKNENALINMKQKNKHDSINSAERSFISGDISVQSVQFSRSVVYNSL